MTISLDSNHGSQIPVDNTGVFFFRTYSISVENCPWRTGINCCFDYATAKRDFNEDKKITFEFWVSTLTPAVKGDINHCSLLSEIRDDGFCVWTTSGEKEGFLPLSRSDWDSKKCCAVTIF